MVGCDLVVVGCDVVVVGCDFVVVVHFAIIRARDSLVLGGVVVVFGLVVVVERVVVVEQAAVSFAPASALGATIQIQIRTATSTPRLPITVTAPNGDPPRSASIETVKHQELPCGYNLHLRHYRRGRRGLER